MDTSTAPHEQHEPHNSRFGIQPARRLIRKAGYTVSQAAEVLDINRTHLNNALLGRIAPSAELRDGLVRLLEQPIENLFTAESIAARYGSRASSPGRGFSFDQPVIRPRRKK